MRIRLRLAWALTAAAAGCSSAPPPTSKPLAAVADGVADAAAEVLAVDTAPAELATVDVPATSGACPGSPGCPCTAAEQCSTGVCADAADSATAKACAYPFGAGCAPGFAAYTAQIGEGAVVCVPATPKLCNPCQQDSDCAALVGSGALCVDRGASGRFCGVACDGQACPNGYTCLAATGATGTPAKQCQPTDSAGALTTCACSVGAASLKLATPCKTVTTDANGQIVGACSGLRTCGSGTLSACSGAVPATETCDNADNDCNGQTDDGQLCTDANPCTSDTCAAGQCAHAGQAGPCEDGNTCTVGDTCQSSACSAGAAINCDDNSPCTDDFCDPATGKCAPIFAPQGSPCEDGDPCTLGDSCSAGSCSPGAPKACPGAACSIGQCSSQGGGCQFADAPDKSLCNDGNPCTENDACNKAVCSGTQLACDDADPCTADSCALSGACTHTAANDGAPCDDKKAWTVGDVCSKGQCVPGLDTKQCAANADCAAAEDGNLCNGTLFCNKATGVCQLNPKTVVSCPSVDDTVCRANQCQPKTGLCVLNNLNELLPCEDGNLCTSGEACVGGTCKPSASGDTCLCKQDSDCAVFEDGDACNGTLFCNLAKAKCDLNPKTVVVCPTAQDTPCSKNVCGKATGQCALQATATGTPCDADGSGCTPIDLCKGGVCVADTNTCPCQQDSDCTAQEDGDLCNGTLYCDKAKTVCTTNPKTIVVCATGLDTVCSQTVCAPSTGTCSKLAISGPCNDGDACTLSDTCAAGACKPGSYVCGACASDADCPDDGDACNGQEMCDKGQAPTACSVKPGTAAAEGSPCSDSSLCTTGDLCNGGSCLGKALNCDDANACTADACTKATGACSHKPQAKGAACDDNSKCSQNDACDGAASCVGLPVDCSSQDGPCTVGTCDENTAACLKKKKADLSACEDGQPCTIGDSCSNGVCKSGPSACDEERLDATVPAGKSLAIGSVGFGSYVVQWIGAVAAQNAVRFTDADNSRENEEQGLVATTAGVQGYFAGRTLAVEGSSASLVVSLGPTLAKGSSLGCNAHLVSDFGPVYLQRVPAHGVATTAVQSLGPFKADGAYLGACSNYVTITVTGIKAVPLPFADGSVGTIGHWTTTFSGANSTTSTPISGQLVYSLATPQLAAAAMQVLAVPVSNTPHQWDARVMPDGTDHVALAWVADTGKTLSLRLMAKGGQLLGSAATVVQTAAAGLQTPRVLGRPDGSVVVAWGATGVDSAGLGLQMRVVSLAGTVTGTALPINFAGAGDQTLGDLALLPDGTVLVAFVDTLGDGNGSGVKVRRFHPDLTPKSAETLLNAKPEGNQFDPVLAVLDGGGYAAAFQGPLNTAWTRRFDPTGNPLPGAPERSLAADPAGMQSAPKIATTGANLLAIWMTAPTATQSAELKAKLLSPLGLELKPEFAVAPGPAKLQPALAAGAGKYLAAWIEPLPTAAVHLRWLSGQGIAADAPFVQLPETATSSNPAVAIAADGSGLVAYGSGAGAAIGYAAVAAGGSVSKALFSVAKPGSTANDKPAVARVVGGYVIGWQALGADGSGLGVALQRINDEGSPGVVVQANVTSKDDQRNVAVAVQDDTLIACWESFGGDVTASYGIVCRTFGAKDLVAQTGEWSPHPPGKPDQTQPTLAFLGKNKLAIGWTMTGLDGAGTAVQAGYADPTGNGLGPRVQVNRNRTGDQSLLQLVPAPGGALALVWQSVGQESATDAGGVHLRIVTPP